MTYRKALDKMDRILEQNLLYDFYGELLTEHQQRVYEDAVYNDMSLSEIAGEQGISRQGVHDLIKRCDKILQDYEEKLRLIEKFTKTKENVTKIAVITNNLEQLTNSCNDDVKDLVMQMKLLTSEMIEEL